MKRMIVSMCAGLVLLGASAARAQDSGGVSGGAPRQERIEKRIVLRDGGGPGDLRMGPGMEGRGFGRGMRGRSHPWGPRLTRELQLTDAQREKARDILDRQRRAAIQSRADLAIARLDMRKLVRADRPDEGAIDAQIDRIARIRTAMAKARVSSMLEIRGLLTPEQREKFRELRLNGPEGMPGMRGRGGPGGIPEGWNEGDGDEDDDGGDGDTAR